MCAWVHFCAVKLFYPEFTVQDKQSSHSLSFCFHFLCWLEVDLRGKLWQGSTLSAAGGGAQSRGEDPWFTLDTKKQTKAAMEVLQIFKWDLTVQRPYASLLREDLQREAVGGD